MTFNTGKPVPSTDPRDLYDNAENLDKLVNGVDPFYADRKGKLRQSWAGMENDFDTAQEGRETAFTLSQADKESRFQAFLVSSGYVSKGDYAAGVVLAERNEYVAVDAATTGTSAGLYRPNASATLPLTLTGTWATDKTSLVLLGDDVLRQELANGKSALVDSAVVGWRERTVADRLNDTANVKDYGAIADGTNHPLSERYATLADAQVVYPHATALTQTIDWAAAQAALNSGAPRVHFPGWRYVISDDLSRTTSVMIVADGATRLEFASGKRLTIEGSLSALPALAADIAKTSRGVTFAAAPNLTPGDVFIAYNPADFSWSPHRAYYRAGEFFQVHSVNGNTANIYGVSADNYSAASMTMHKVNGVRVALEDIEIVSAGGTTPVVIRFGVGVTTRNFRGSGPAVYQIELDRCYQAELSGGAAVNNSPAAGENYGIIISNCHRVTITGGGHSASRHAIALGGGSGIGAVPCRDIVINNMVLMTNSVDVGAADMHGNCDRVTYNNCVLNTHANISGRDSAFVNCTIYGRTSPADGSVMYGGEIVGGTYRIIDCTFITSGNLQTFGAIDMVAKEVLREDWTVIVRNLTIKGGAGGEFAKLVRIGVANGESKKCNVDIRGVRNELAQSMCVLWVRCEANTAQTVVSDGHVVDDVYGPAGMYLIQPTGAALNGIPTRQMEQTGEISVTTADTANFARPLPVNFRYPYSKRPSASVTASGVDGATFTTLGGAAPVPVLNALTATQIRPAVVAPSGTFTNGVAVLLHWRAGIKEI